jgi:hypothetical protein
MSADLRKLIGNRHSDAKSVGQKVSTVFQRSDISVDAQLPGLRHLLVMAGSDEGRRRRRSRRAVISNRCAVLAYVPRLSKEFPSRILGDS